MGQTLGTALGQTLGTLAKTLGTAQRLPESVPESVPEVCPKLSRRAARSLPEVSPKPARSVPQRPTQGLWQSFGRALRETGGKAASALVAWHQKTFALLGARPAAELFNFGRGQGATRNTSATHYGYAGRPEVCPKFCFLEAQRPLYSLQKLSLQCAKQKTQKKEGNA